MASNLYKIALVGGGQLGSRYLQGIVKSYLDVDLYIVDPSNDSLKICHERILEVNPTYDIDKIKISEKTLNKGDMSILFCGGHSFECLRKETIIYEIKNGPYKKNKDLIRF